MCPVCSGRWDGGRFVSGRCRLLVDVRGEWVSAAVHYWELTGDREILEELFPYAEHNVAAFEKQRTADGLQDALGWGFVDWGYVRNPGPSDMGVNLHYLAACATWSGGVKRWNDQSVPITIAAWRTM